VFGLLLAWIFLPSERITRLKIFAVSDRRCRCRRHFRRSASCQ
jgi:hypothetical protein